MTLHPRPASPDWPNNVETDHPHVGATSHCAVVKKSTLRRQRHSPKLNSRQNLAV